MERQQPRQGAYILTPLPRYLTVQSVVSSLDVTRPRDFYFPGEAHDFWEMVYVVSGNASVSADSRIYRLSCGQIIFHPPMEFHRVWTAKDSEAHLIIVAFAADGEGMAPFVGQQFRLSMAQESMLRRTAGELNAVLHPAADAPTDPAGAHLAAIHLEEFLLSLLQSGPSTVSAASENAAVAYRQIVETIHAHLEENLSVSDLARLCNRSVSSLNKVFRRFSDRGVMKYMLALKVRRAMEWLDEGLSVGQVSDRLAFSSPNYFHVVFKRESGMTPSQYRARAEKSLPLPKL